MRGGEGRGLFIALEERDWSFENCIIPRREEG
jgi:hypothetical protein